MPERSLISRTFGDSRQFGAMLSYKIPKFKIYAMVSDGRPMAVSSAYGKTTLHSRIEYDPLKKLGMAGFITTTDTNNFVWGIDGLYKLKKFFFRNCPAQFFVLSDLICVGFVVDDIVRDLCQNGLLCFVAIGSEIDRSVQFSVSLHGFVGGIGGVVDG